MKLIIDLNAVILSVSPENDFNLTVLTISNIKNVLPWGIYNPKTHQTMEHSLRHWVKNKTDMDLVQVEQLYTFGDSGRFSYGDPNRHIISTGYIANIQPKQRSSQSNGRWSDIYQHFPWEDFRTGRPTVLDDFILPKLYEWSQDEATHKRIRFCFGHAGDLWQEESILERYELMYEANLVFEAIRDANENMSAETYVSTEDTKLPTGRYMQFDHRRILATAIARMRVKVKNHPVIFELMPDIFSLFDLQKTTEGILGYNLHKQNFRRFVEREKLVTKTGKMRSQLSGRPASLYRFNDELVGKPNVHGLRIGNSNSAY